MMARQGRCTSLVGVCVKCGALAGRCTGQPSAKAGAPWYCGACLGELIDTTLADQVRGRCGGAECFRAVPACDLEREVADRAAVVPVPLS